MAEIRLTKDVVAEKFARAAPAIPRAVEPARTELDWAYRQAAAVLTTFRPERLRPYGHSSVMSTEVAARLLSDSTVTYDEEYKPTWMLRHEVRRRALEQLGNREAMTAALDANPDRPAGVQQRMLELSIRGTLPSLAEQKSLEELESTLQAVRWLEGIITPLPTATEVQRHVDWAQLLKPFRYLAGDDFRGRNRELEILREYVGVLPPETFAKAAVRRLREVLSLKEKPPLLIYGPGGIGKSTLVARFILEHVDAGEGARFPFTYVDFDRPDMTALEPATILLEAVRQLGIQYPRARELSELLGNRWRQAISQVQADSSLLEGSYSLGQVRQTSARDRRALLDDLAEMLDRIGESDKPFLLVLDTFEEVQYRSRDFVAELWYLLDELQTRIPRLRTVIAGRAPVEAFETQELRLGDLDAAAAESFLEARGVTDRALARRLVRQVGGNPLSLELAIEIISREGIGRRGLQDLGTWKSLWLQLQENSIQGYLYRRLLDHIPDEDVRLLAHPGLVLRWITPDLIAEVLAEACNITVRDEAHARELFDKLRQEATLVTLDADGSLRHRTDVRRIMLDALRQDKPIEVLKIHQQAADYYHDRPDMRDRAEEIYHRLCLRLEPDRIAALWQDGVEQFLFNAGEEIPEQARALLASLLRQTGEPLDWQSADLETWERIAEKQARDLMGYERWEQALQALSEREERTADSPLYLLEAQVLARLDRWPEARRVAKEGIYALSQVEKPEILRDLLWLAARADEKAGQYRQALQMLNEADALGSEKDSLPRLEIAIDRLRLYRLVSPNDRTELDARREQAARLFDQVPISRLARDRRLLREAAVELGATYPHVLRQMLEYQELVSLSAAQRQVLARALGTWDTLVSQEIDAPPGVLARSIDLDPGTDLFQRWSDYMQYVEPDYLPRVLGRLLGEHPAPADVVRLLVDNLLVAQEHEPRSVFEVRTGNLTESQLWDMSNALLETFNRAGLDRMLREGLDRRLDDVTLSDDLQTAVFDLIAKAEREGWTFELAREAQNRNPANRALAELVQSQQRPQEGESYATTAAGPSILEIDPDNPPYGAIRELLRESFTPRDLRRFAQDRPAFRSVLTRFGPTHGLEDMIDDLLDYSRTHLVWQELLAGVAEERPSQYERFRSQL